MEGLVGVMPLWDGEKASIWMLPGYLGGLKAVGLDSFIFPMTDDEEELARLAGLCDGLLLTGGHDVDPHLYGEDPLDSTVVPNATRDHMDRTVLELALAADKPVLGICRGLQLLNVALGGTLWQDLPQQCSSKTDHHMAAPYDRRCHDVHILPDTPLAHLLQKKTIPVNSIHHQAIKDLAPGLEEMALSDDGLVEAVSKPDSAFVWGVQWHPEYWYKTNPDCMKIFEAFAASMRFA